MGFDQARFREVLGHFATGVTVVTATDDGVPVGFTCQSFTSLSLDPALVALAPGKSSTSWPRIVRAGVFCVNILSDRQEALCRAFAVPGGPGGPGEPGGVLGPGGAGGAGEPGGAGIDKFAGVGWHVGAAGAPVLDGSLAWVECGLEAIHDAGDHELVVGRVLALGVGEGRPLLFYRGGFGSFAV